ncbi:hypothetical protein ERJ75_000092800 [Trypanosoma vivax]|nr:hypothetical protein ERJ75_000092800 [Trypanosoma vivax]
MCARVSGSTVRQRLARPHRTTAPRRAARTQARPSSDRAGPTPGEDTAGAHRHTEACANRGSTLRPWSANSGMRLARTQGSVTTTNAGVKSELETRLEYWGGEGGTSRVRQRGQRFTRAQPRHGAPHAWPSERPPGRHAGHAPANSQTPRLARPRERNVARESGSGADNTTARTAPAVTRAGQG